MEKNRAFSRCDEKQSENNFKFKFRATPKTRPYAPPIIQPLSSRLCLYFLLILWSIAARRTLHAARCTPHEGATRTAVIRLYAVDHIHEPHKQTCGSWRDMW